MRYLHRHDGFGLGEVVVAVAVFVVFVVVFTAALIVGKESSALAGARGRAVLIAEEGIEATRNIRDAAFSNLSDGTYGLAISSSTWTFSESSDTVGIFSRTITIATIDSNTKKVTATVTWQQNPTRTGSVKLDSYLTNWAAAAHVPSWYNSSWIYRKQLTLDHALVAGTSTLSSFPVLVSYTDADLKTTENGGHVATSTGYDIVFTDSDGTTKLDHEIERYTTSTGAIALWVRIPTVSTSTDTTFYIYYGNSSVTSTPENANGVWDINHKLVSHMEDDPDTSHVEDSTSNANHGTKRGAGEPAVMASGEIGDAQTYDGSNDRIDAGASSSISNVFASGGTVEAWIYPTGWGGNSNGRIYDKGDTLGWSLYVDDVTGTAELTFVHGDTSGGGYGKWITGNSTIALGQWQHVAVVFDKSSISNDPTVYINGVIKATTENHAPATAYVTDETKDLNVGNGQDEATAFAGTLDEIRVSATSRPAGWITTEYNNHTNQGTGVGKFIKTVGAEENC